MSSTQSPPVTGHDLARELLNPEILVPFIEQALPRLLSGLERLAAAFVQAAPALVRAMHAVDHARRQIEAAPPSPGYEPMLRALDLDPLAARFMAYYVRGAGRERAERDRIEHQDIPAALRRLARPGRRDRTIACTAETLRALPNAERHMRAVFARIDRIETGEAVLACLARAGAKAPSACRELAALARSVADRVPTRRARPISPASAAHELALILASRSGHEAAYTYSDYRQTFTDRVTQATEREFGLESFDPRPAVRRLRLRKTTD